MEKFGFYNGFSAQYIYVLKLQHGKYYIGYTTNPTSRLKQHKFGKTSEFVKKNLPIKEAYFKVLDGMTKKEALREETKLTAKFAIEYGVEKVYGGVMAGNIFKRECIFDKILLKYDITYYDEM